MKTPLDAVKVYIVQQVSTETVLFSTNAGPYEVSVVKGETRINSPVLLIALVGVAAICSIASIIRRIRRNGSN